MKHLMARTASYALEICTPTLVANTEYECWSCDRCKLLYEAGDTIVHRKCGNDDFYICPNCRKHIWGGSREWYLNEYLVMDIKPTETKKPHWLKRLFKKGN